MSFLNIFCSNLRLHFALFSLAVICVQPALAESYDDSYDDYGYSDSYEQESDPTLAIDTSEFEFWNLPDIDYITGDYAKESEQFITFLDSDDYDTPTCDSCENADTCDTIDYAYVDSEDETFFVAAQTSRSTTTTSTKNQVEGEFTPINYCQSQTMNSKIACKEYIKGMNIEKTIEELCTKFEDDKGETTPLQCKETAGICLRCVGEKAEEKPCELKVKESAEEKSICRGGRDVTFLNRRTSSRVEPAVKKSVCAAVVKDCHYSCPKSGF